MMCTKNTAVPTDARPQSGEGLPARFRGRWFAGALLAAAGAGAARAQDYQIQALPPLPGYLDSFACGIDSAGVVVGTSRSPGVSRATRWVGGVPEDLGTLPGWERAIPLDIASDGSRIVGEVLKAGVWVPFVREGGSLTELPVPSGATVAGGWQVSNDGVIAGRAVTPQGLRACVWQKTGGVWGLTVLTPLTGFPNAGAWGLNQAGAIAGASLVGGNWSTARATLWAGGIPGGPPGLENVTATIAGLNDVGQAVGDREVSPGGAWHATYYDGQGLTDLGALVYPNSYAHRINNAGTIIGQSYANGVDPAGFPEDGKQAFIWRAGTMAAVNDLIPPASGWDVKQLWDISESGRVAGYGRFNGLWRGCLLAPVCYPDCNADTQLTVADFGCFQTKFVATDPYADCNGDGVRTVADFGCFQTKFVAGCQ